MASLRELLPRRPDHIPKARYYGSLAIGLLLICGVVVAATWTMRSLTAPGAPPPYPSAQANSYAYDFYFTVHGFSGDPSKVPTEYDKLLDENAKLAAKIDLNQPDGVFYGRLLSIQASYISWIRDHGLKQDARFDLLASSAYGSEEAKVLTDFKSGASGLKDIVDQAHELMQEFPTRATTSLGASYSPSTLASAAVESLRDYSSAQASSQELSRPYSSFFTGDPVAARADLANVEAYLDNLSSSPAPDLKARSPVYVEITGSGNEADKVAYWLTYANALGGQNEVLQIYASGTNVFYCATAVFGTVAKYCPEPAQGDVILEIKKSDQGRIGATVSQGAGFPNGLQGGGSILLRNGDTQALSQASLTATSLDGAWTKTVKVGSMASHHSLAVDLTAWSDYSGAVRIELFDGATPLQAWFGIIDSQAGVFL